VVTFANPERGPALSAHHLRLTLKALISTKSSPQKRQIWDVNLLITWLPQHAPDENSLFEVSRHVAVLLLASGRRVHDLTTVHRRG